MSFSLIEWHSVAPHCRFVKKTNFFPLNSQYCIHVLREPGECQLPLWVLGKWCRWRRIYCTYHNSHTHLIRAGYGLEPCCNCRYDGREKGESTFWAVLVYWWLRYYSAAATRCCFYFRFSLHDNGTINEHTNSRTHWNNFAISFLNSQSSSDLRGARTEITHKTHSLFSGWVVYTKSIAIYQLDSGIELNWESCM